MKNLLSKIFLKVIFFIEFKALSDKKSKGKKTTFKKKTKKIMFKVSWFETLNKDEKSYNNPAVQRTTISPIYMIPNESFLFLKFIF